MSKKSIIAALLLIFMGTKAFSMGDTVVVSYDNKPVTFDRASSVPVASVYMEIMWKIMEEADNYEFFLRVNDENAYNSLNKKIDSVALNSTNPNDILVHVKNNRFKLDYVRLVLAKMAKRYIGVRTPLSIKMAFDQKGNLSYFECRGFIKTDDGFALRDSVMLPIKFHRSNLAEFGI